MEAGLNSGGIDPACATHIIVRYLEQANCFGLEEAAGMCDIIHDNACVDLAKATAVFCATQIQQRARTRAAGIKRR